jgi:hypothetical protein
MTKTVPLKQLARNYKRLRLALAQIHYASVEPKILKISGEALAETAPGRAVDHLEDGWPSAQ